MVVVESEGDLDAESPDMDGLEAGKKCCGVLD